MIMSLKPVGIVFLRDVLDAGFIVDRVWCEGEFDFSIRDAGTSFFGAMRVINRLFGGYLRVRDWRDLGSVDGVFFSVRVLEANKIINFKVRSRKC